MPRISRLQIIESPAALADRPAALDADLEWVKKRGVDVERLPQDASSPAPISLSGPLPLVFVDGNMALSGRYPTREEMGIWMMFGFVSPNDSNGGPRLCTL
ncbi:arsenic metallochaperone ArsD family protein [Oxalobacter vibrioformis]|uniref:Arsenic metallochaperone ArsD family protein n=1 Tax=Oxalobacter vibrioformis TaxID=933080 RepID=A0A9E9LWQ1_9BURK|nr:arsenic metallochaperone ArsD family protein [Oxalobacter vibrioformis]WAW09010.1 arsenic metallochaperone ArsD family protein [Oxalobacter vibrioformis]